jgi:heme A synthase
MFKKLFTYLGQTYDNLSLSYKSLRRLIGILGILLPFVCVLGGYLITQTPIQQSISIYYYTNMRDFFVGLMFLVSLFLITYKGYQVIDSIVTSVTGVFGLGIPLFPCFSEAFKNQKVGLFQIVSTTSDIIHLTCAASFFTLLALNSIFLFTRTENPGQQKNKRNIIYVVCGIVMLLCLLGILIAFIKHDTILINDYNLVLICETIALMAFGISWLVKGETLFAD